MWLCDSRDEEDQAEILPSESFIDVQLPHDITRSFHMSMHHTKSSLVFSPESSFLFAWDLLMIVLLVYQSFVLPYTICFDPVLPLAMVYIDFLIVMFFLADIGTMHTAVSFNKGYYVHGRIVLSRKQIAANYIRFWCELVRFWMDVLASTPYTWFEGTVIERKSSDQDDSISLNATPSLLRLMRLLRFMRLLRLAKLKQIMLRMEELVSNKWIGQVFMFCHLLFLLLAFAHWLACFWYFFGKYEATEKEGSWVSALTRQNESQVTIYVTALYWTITTMTTVGYGDVVPRSRNEMIFAIVTMMMSSWAFAYVLGSINSVVIQKAEEEAAIRAQTRGINRFLRKYDVGKSLQSRVRRYLQYRMDDSRKRVYDEKELLKLLSTSLRQEIYDCVNGAILRTVSILAHVETNFISHLAKYLQVVSCSPGDAIIMQGEVTTEMYFIQKGAVDIIFNTSSVKVLGKREYFGEIGFFLKQPRCASAKSVLFVEMLSISRRDFSKIMGIFPEVMRSLESQVFDETSTPLAGLGVQCYQCAELGHVASKCPILLLSLGQEEHKQRWIAARKPKTKYISRGAETEAMVHRNPFRRVKLKPAFRQVVGMPQVSPERSFPRTPRLHQLAESYALLASSSRFKNILSLDASDSVEERSLGPRRVTFVFDSEVSQHAVADEEDRPIQFRHELVKWFKEEPIVEIEHYEGNREAEETDRTSRRFLRKEPEMFMRTLNMPFMS